MPLSNAERQKRHYERRKLAASAKSEVGQELTRPYLKRAFFEFIDSDVNASEYEIPLHLAGIEPPSFVDDSGPIFPDILDGLDVPDHITDSVGRAELIVECLLDAAAGLARILNRYKRQAIDNALADLEQTGMHDHFERAAAEAETARLTKLIAALDKPVRWTVPRWNLKGD